MLKPNEIDRRNSPPIVRGGATTLGFGRTDQIITFDLSATTNLSLDLTLELGDVDDERVEARVFVDSTALGLGNVATSTEVVGGGALAQKILSIPKSQFINTGCYRVVLVASNAFLPQGDGGLLDLRRPVREGDATSLVWWVQAVNNSSDSTSMSSCPQ